ncbi:hypothetical protein HYV71_02565 [Candidatus Uhrbacteria bacterium]|nr:hypothetical protein [Candidatus Uhrbacteria bacterium]
MKFVPRTQHQELSPYRNVESRERIDRSTEIEQKLDETYAACENLRLQPDFETAAEINTCIYELYLKEQDTDPRTREASLEILRAVVDRVTSEIGDDTLSRVLYRVMPLVKIKNRKRELAAYHRNKGEITLHPDFSSSLAPSQVLKSFHELGSHPPFVILHHEYIHSLQNDLPHEEAKKAIRETMMLAFGSALLFSVVDRVIPGATIALVGSYALYLSRDQTIRKILGETQAFIGAFRAAPTPQESIVSYVEEIIRTGYTKGRRSDMEKFAIAYDDTRILYALGYSDAEIGRLVKDARWNPKRKCYDTIEYEINRAKIEQNYTESDIDNLVALDDLERYRRLIMIQRITEQELLKGKR